MAGLKSPVMLCFSVLSCRKTGSTSVFGPSTPYCLMVYAGVLFPREACFKLCIATVCILH